MMIRYRGGSHLKTVRDEVAVEPERFRKYIMVLPKVEFIAV
jgi:hypothetical protein